ncbi:MAG: extracellular solute-binding protein [Lachnospiraceae bacterium]|nr:extracellular solute-binding protein [Lachnospiraceae bacterium]
MKKKLIAGIMAVVLAAGLLAGCGGNSSSSESAPPAAEEEAVNQGAPAEPQQADTTEATGEDVTIKVAIWDYSSTEYYKTMFDAFRETYPNIAIEIVEFTSDEYDTVITTQLGGHQDFDVVFMKGTPSLAALINQGHVYALDDLLAGDESFDADAYAGLVDALSLEGHTYALPFRYDNNLLFYNKKLFDDAGVAYPKDGMSMEEYHALAKQMTSGEGNDKVYGALVAQWVGNAYMYAARTEEFVFDDPTTYEALIPYYNEILAMQDEGIIYDYGMLKTSNLHYTGIFYKQQTAMLQMGTWFVNNLFENVQDFEWGVCSMPNNVGMGNENCIGGVTPVSIGAYAKHPAEAWQFIKYVCGEEGAKTLASCGVIPAYSLGAVGEIFDAAPQTYAGAPENLSKYLSCEKKVIEQPMNAKGGEIATVLEEENSAIMTKSVTPEEGVLNMIDRVNAILEE